MGQSATFGGNKRMLKCGYRTPVQWWSIFRYSRRCAVYGVVDNAVGLGPAVPIETETAIAIWEMCLDELVPIWAERSRSGVPGDLSSELGAMSDSRQPTRRQCIRANRWVEVTATATATATATGDGDDDEDCEVENQTSHQNAWKRPGLSCGLLCSRSGNMALDT